MPYLHTARSRIPYLDPGGDPVSYIESDRHNESDRRVLRGELDIPNADILYRKRACDAERDRYVHHLSECMRLGYITDDIFHARMAEALQAVTHDDLQKLLADLPDLTIKGMKYGFHPTVLQRRWLHVAGITSGAVWAIVIPMGIYGSTGDQHGQHSGITLAVLAFFIITGIAATIANIAFWIIWEDA